MIIVFSLKNNFFQASVVLYQCCIAYSAYSEEKINVIKVTIFNITSLTSGAYGKEIGPNEVLYPKSYMRVSGQRTPYGNISQTYHLLIENKR